MTLYLTLFLVSLLLAIFEDTKLRYSCYSTLNLPRWNAAMIIIILIFACVSGFRFQLGGTDYDYYQYFYNQINGQHDFLSTIRYSEYEVGYTAFVYLCANILHLSYNGSLVVEAFVFSALMYVGLKRYMPNWGIFLMFFMYKMFFYVTFVAMRQALTVAGFFLIMRFLEERKIWKYYASLSIVSTFHYGALILFFLYPIFGLKVKKEQLVLLGIAFGATTLLSDMTGSLLNVVVSVLGLPQLADKAAGYVEDGESLNILYTIEYFVLYIMVLSNYDKIKQRFEHADFVIIIYLIVLPIVTLFRSTLILVRELPYFYPAYAILFYYVYAVLKSRRLIFIVFVVLCLLGMLRYMELFDNGHFMEYRAWLFNPNIHFFQ